MMKQKIVVYLIKLSSREYLILIYFLLTFAVVINYSVCFR